MTASSARSRSPFTVVVSMESISWRASSAESTGGFPFLITYFGPRTEAAGFMECVKKSGVSTRMVGSQKAEIRSARLLPNRNTGFPTKMAVRQPGIDVDFKGHSASGPRL